MPAQTIRMTGAPVMSQENQALLSGGAILVFSQSVRATPPAWIPREKLLPVRVPASSPEHPAKPAA